MIGFDDRDYTAGDLNQLAGLSYRQLNDWEAKGALPASANRRERWRRFTPREVFAAMVCAEIRRRFGVPLDKVRFVLDFMRRDNANHLAGAIRLMDRGLSVYLLTDLAETFVMDSDLEFEMLLSGGYFRADVPQSFLFVSINPLVERLRAAVKTPSQITADTVEGSAHDHGPAPRQKDTTETAPARKPPKPRMRHRGHP